MLAAVWWWRGQTTRHRCQAPFLDVCLEEDEAALPEVDVYLTWSVCADCWEEVLSLETVSDVLELLAVAGEEDGAGSWAVAATNYIALDVGRPVWSWHEWLVVAAVSR